MCACARGTGNMRNSIQHVQHCTRKHVRIEAPSHIHNNTIIAKFFAGGRPDQVFAAFSSALAPACMHINAETSSRAQRSGGCAPKCMLSIRCMGWPCADVDWDDRPQETGGGASGQDSSWTISQSLVLVADSAGSKRDSRLLQVGHVAGKGVEREREKKRETETLRDREFEG